ncbi:MAG: hypothetical protein QXN20_07895, partial [Candidatus Bathyarchaeia archaeon]
LERELQSRTASLEKEVSSFRSEMNARFDSLETKVTLIEDVTRLKMEVKALTEKLAAVATP